jgi:hypothetical protein
MSFGPKLVGLQSSVGMIKLLFIIPTGDYKKRVDGHFFLSTPNPRPIYEISITSGFYLMVSFTSEDKYAMHEG